jgi:pyruvate formate lyase activating enzyme
MNPSGRILHLQRLSTEDGPGIRTTVFFKGCPLRCWWCHNPESISLHRQAQWHERLCIDCGACLEACPQAALTRSDLGIHRDRDRCIACGACSEACPSGAQEILGQEIDADRLVKELVKDRAFFIASGGGVTLSGGEPLYQPQFAAAVARRLAALGISVALDTSGLVSWEALEALLPHIDLILYDLKLIDSALHRVWTGASNRLILENFRSLCAILPQRYPHLKLWVRTPLIPVATCNPANLGSIAAFLDYELEAAGLAADWQQAVDPSGAPFFRWELCAFNNLCRDKYRRLGIDWEFKRTQLLTASELAQAAEWAGAGRGVSLEATTIHVTGEARLRQP